MAELELKVEYAGGEKGVHARRSQPAEDVRHHLGNISRRSSRANEHVPVEHSSVSRTEETGFEDEAIHHHAMRLQQIIDGIRVQIGDEVVGAFGILNLEDVVAVTQNLLSVEDCGPRLLVELVALYQEG